LLELRDAQALERQFVRAVVRRRDEARRVAGGHEGSALAAQCHRRGIVEPIAERDAVVVGAQIDEKPAAAGFAERQRRAPVVVACRRRLGGDQRDRPVDRGVFARLELQRTEGRSPVQLEAERRGRDHRLPTARDAEGGTVFGDAQRGAAVGRRDHRVCAVRGGDRERPQGAGGGEEAAMLRDHGQVSCQ